MAPVPFPFEFEPSPSSFPALLRRAWLRLYSQGEDPVFQVYREKLADFVHEYRAEVFLFTSSTVGSLSRSAKGGPASTTEQAILYASLDALVDLRQQEVGMQAHPGLSLYPPWPLRDRFCFHQTQSATGRPSTSLATWSLSMS